MFLNVQKIPEGIRQETNYLSCDYVHLENYRWFLCVCQWSSCEEQTEDFKVGFLHTSSW